MKPTVIAATVAAVLFSLPLVAISQEPVLDLEITNLNYVCLPGDSALCEAEVQLASVGETDLILTEIAFYLDGAYMGSVPYDVLPALQDPCTALAPPCDTPAHICWPDTINGQIIQGSCTSWVLPSGCACLYLIWKQGIYGPVAEPSTLTATADPHGEVQETDETNNTMTILLGPTPILGTRWGLIKSLYR